MFNLFGAPYIYFLGLGISAFAGFMLFLLYKRRENYIIVDVLQPNQKWRTVKKRVVDGYKLVWDNLTIPMNPKNVFHNGNKLKVFLNRKSHKLFSFSELDNSGELSNTWSEKEFAKFTKKLVALSKNRAKVIDTTPLIIIMALLGINIFLGFVIARRLGVF